MPNKRDNAAWAALPEWQRSLIINDNGNAKAIIANAMIALRLADEFCGALGYDKMRQATMATAALPWDPHIEKPRRWADHDDRMLAEWLQHNGVMVGPGVAHEAAEAVSVEASYHPVLSWLEALSWDGEPRLDEWAIAYLGAADTPFVRAVAARWMISAVARVDQPGCKADCAIVLEGPQGKGKSTALAVLAGDEWFSDDLPPLGTKEAAEHLRGVWIAELAEMDAVARAADIASVKAFISRRIDRYRLPYGRNTMEFPRQCVFAASTNKGNWNRDETGARRWWPIDCGVIDVVGLADARNQLWAEARDRYVAGEPWWLDTDELIDEAEELQGAKTVDDPWIDKLLPEIVHLNSISSAEALNLIGVPAERQGRAEAIHIGSILRQMGWQRRRSRDRHELSWRYYRPDNQ